MREPRPRRLPLALLVALAGLAPAASAHAAAAPQPVATAWLLVDEDDGVRLAAQAPGQRLPIASTTKLMTAYLALHHLPLSRRLVAPPYTPVPGESLLGLEPGERESVRDLLYGLLLPSGNDAAVTLADGVSGSVPAFVAAMNRTATRLGLHDTHYATPVGLDSPRNYSTARDLLRLVTVLRREPIFRRITDTERATLRDGGTVRHIVNLNDLVLEFPWVTGVKTGNTEEAGHVLIASAKRHGISLIAVLLGAPSISTRDAGSLSLLRYGFARYRPRQPIRTSRPVASVPVRYARPSLPLVPANDVRVWARNDQRVRVSSKTPRRVTGPIPRGRRLGTATVSVEGGATRRVVLRAGRSVPAPVIERTVAEAIPGRPSRTLVLGLAALALLLGAVITATVMTPVGESLVSAARSRRER